MRRPFWLPLLAALLLSGCGADLNSPGEALRIYASTIDPAYIGEDYTFDFVVQGGLAPYNFKVREGKLPPGLTLENGTISGAPSKLGRYPFSLQVSDANLSQAVEDFTVEVTTAPPARLVLNVPPTTVSDIVRVPISVEEARELRALRTQITWDAALFRFVEGSVTPSQNSVALLQKVGRGQLSVDIAFLGPALSGDAELFSFELEPIKPSTLTLSARTEYRSNDGGHGFSSTEDSADVATDPSADANTDANLTDLDNDGVDASDDLNDNDPNVGSKDAIPPEDPGAGGGM